MDDLLTKMKTKGRELLVLLTAAAVLLSMAMGVIGDAMMILIVGGLGWFLSDKDETKK